MSKQKNYIRSSVGFSKEQYQYLECLAKFKEESVANVLREIVSKERNGNQFVGDLDALKIDLEKLKEIGLISDVIVDDQQIKFTTYNRFDHTFLRDLKGYASCCLFLDALEVGYRFKR